MLMAGGCYRRHWSSRNIRLDTLCPQRASLIPYTMCAELQAIKRIKPKLLNRTETQARGNSAMAGVSWEIKGTEFGNCNCDYGCPCQFMGRPSSVNGDCRYAMFTQINEGQYADVRLDGLRFVWMGGWPGAVHEGNGVLQLIIDDGADDEQRKAIRRIVYNEDTDELLTNYSIYCAMCTTIHEPIVAPIELDFDVEARTAHGDVPGIVVCDIEPVRNPVTGKAHRAQIVLPEGFGSTMLETASGSVKSTGTVPLEFSDTFASFSKLHMTDHGIVR